MISKTRINQIMQEKVKKLLGIALHTYFKVITNLFNQNNHRKRHNAGFSALLLHYGSFNMIFENTKAAEILIVEGHFNKWIRFDQSLNVWRFLLQNAIVFLHITNLMRLLEFVLDGVADSGVAVLAMETLSAIGKNIIGMNQAL